MRCTNLQMYLFIMGYALSSAASPTFVIEKEGRENKILAGMTPQIKEPVT